MSSPPDLKLDWCSYEAAKYACEKWHYSKRMPAPKYNHLGVWESGQFIGAVIFSKGNNNNLHRPFGINALEICELTRIALTNHITPVTRILSIAVSILKKKNPELKLIVSYADPNVGHAGGIYQGGNWVYSGISGKGIKYIDKSGKEHHSRCVSPSGVKKQFGIYKSVLKPQDCTLIHLEGKHRYLYPLTDDMRRKIEPLRKPYPKKKDLGVSSVTASTSSFHEESGGSIPTLTHEKNW